MRREASTSSTPAPGRPLVEGLRRIAPCVAPHRRALGLALLLSGLCGALSAIEPLVMKWMFETFLSGREARAALWPLALLVGTLLSVELLGSLRAWLLWKVRLGLDFALTQATVGRLHSLPLSDARQPRVGASLARVERGIASCLSALQDLATHALPALTYLMVAAVAMLALEWQLALAVMLTAPLPPLLGGWAQSAQLARERGLREQRGSAFGRFHEVLTGLVAMKTFAMEEQEKRRFLSGISDANGLALRGVSRDVRTHASKNLLMMLARILVFAVGGVLVMRGQLGLGTLIAFVGYLGGVFAPVATLAGLRTTLRSAAEALDAVLSVLEEQDSLGDAPDAREVGPLCGQVEFHKVSFMYRPERPVLREVSLSVQPGELVALVGPSGSGKSTLMSLLQRLYDPTSGTISVDGVDIRSLKQRSLREQIGVVLQEGSLFEGSVRDNIAFGHAPASDAAIETAARAANAHEFIEALPGGYHAVVGEQGPRLTESQRKRIAIARVLLKDTPILILDEAGSGDAGEDAAVQQALARLLQGRTTFVIAHRLSTIVAADRVAVFREGAIVELGTHEELLAQQGYYASFVHRQLHGGDANAA